MLDDATETSTELADIEEIIGPGGMTEAIRRVLQSTTEALTPTETKDALIASGFSLAGYSNALASIHTILKRLVQAGDVEPTLKDGKTAYLWKGIRRFPRTGRSEAKKRAFIGKSLGASRSFSRTSDEMLKVQIESARKRS